MAGGPLNRAKSSLPRVWSRFAGYLAHPIRPGSGVHVIRRGGALSGPGWHREWRILLSGGRAGRCVLWELRGVDDHLFGVVAVVIKHA